MISVIIENENFIQEGKVYINEKEDINHLKNSFRVKEGEMIRGTDGKFEYILKVLEVNKKDIVAEIVEKKDDRYSLNIKITAAIGMLKNDKMNLTIQKLTEIGISEIIPFYSKRCVVKLNEKKDKWDVISKEALKQCQGVKFTKISQPVKLEEIPLENYQFKIVPYEAEKEYSLKNILRKFPEKPLELLYVIGPEGGFTGEEIDFLKNKGCEVVSLGSRILRAETAAVVVGGVLSNEYQ